MAGFSLRIFLPDGAPDGLRVVEKSNWTGCGIVCPRPLFPTAKSRPEFARTGVYVLLGPPGEGELPEVYIGEGDPIRPRLEQHQAKKDFWMTAICFTSKDANLNKAHVQYLESRLVQLAGEAKRCTLENGNAPQLPSLSEADIADTETFLAEMLLCFPVLGVTVFEKPEKPAVNAQMLALNIAGVSARGYESPAGFVVLAGSEVRGHETPSLQDFVKEQKAALLANGVLVPRSGGFRFALDYEFRSPSGAASLIVGAPANGRTAWKDTVGRTLKEIQEP
jgi:hypothetical protein